MPERASSAAAAAAANSSLPPIEDTSSSGRGGAVGPAAVGASPCAELPRRAPATKSSLTPAGRKRLSVTDDCTPDREAWSAAPLAMAKRSLPPTEEAASERKSSGFGGATGSAAWLRADDPPRAAATKRSPIAAVFAPATEDWTPDREASPAARRAKAMRSLPAEDAETSEASRCCCPLAEAPLPAKSVSRPAPELAAEDCTPDLEASSAAPWA